MLRGRPDLVERLRKIWRGSELPDEDETFAVKQILIGEIELARLKRGELSS